VIETDGYLVADVAVENRNAKAQRYSTFDFKLQTPSGQVVDANFSSIDGQLGSGDLVQGGKASGKVVWKVGSAKGAYFVIYKPNPFDASRGVWKVTI
jgi:hypothetical protein